MRVYNYKEQVVQKEVKHIQLEETKKPDLHWNKWGGHALKARHIQLIF